MDTATLNINEYVPYQKIYLDLVPDTPLIKALEDTLQEFVVFFKGIDTEKLSYSYQEGKWTIKELMLHVIDTERIFQYRALRFARVDKTDLAGFSENDFVATSNAGGRDLPSLLDEFVTLRKSTISLFESFSEDALLKIGVSGGNTMSVRAAGYLIIGHQKHHINVVKHRYLV